MKKLFLSLLLICFTIQWTSAQTMAFSAIEVKVKPFTQKDIKEAFEEVFADVEMNKGAIVLERFTGGDSNGMTHRLVFLYTLGEKMIPDEFWASDKTAAFWAKMGNYIEDWGVSYSGRMMSWKEGNLETNPEVHIWDIIPEDPAAFKVAHDKIVDEFKEEFKDKLLAEFDDLDKQTNGVLINSENFQALNLSDAFFPNDKSKKTGSVNELWKSFKSDYNKYAQQTNSKLIYYIHNLS